MSDLGRFQSGGVVPLAVQTPGDGSLSAAPDAAPTAVVRDSHGVSVAAVTLALAGSYSSFALPLPLGPSFVLGTYTVAYLFAVGGVPGTASDTFTVAPGGDPGGRIISMYAYVRPEATYVVAQLSSGNIVQGRNPTL